MRFSHFGRGWQRATLALAPLAMVAILGCSAATSPAPTSEPGEPPPRAPSTPSPTPSPTPAPTSAPVGPTPTPVAINIRDVPMVNVDIHSVPLEDIVFDTFDGRFVRLSDVLPEIHVGLRDAIRPIYNAGYGSEDALPWLTPDDLVIGYESATGAYAYPIKVLNVHEIVNDVIDGVPVLITYCPLCASGAVFSRELDGETLLFGNTSALYQSDLVMYDHGTGSYWFQVLGEAVVGDLTGKRLSLLPAATSPWGDWKALHPDTRLLTSFRPGSPPFSGPRYAGDHLAGIAGASYRDNLDSGNFPFPVSGEKLDGRLRASELVITAEVGSAATAYPIGLIGNAAVNDMVGGERVVVLSGGLTGGVFSADVDGMGLTFRYDGSSYTDEETGSAWSPGGEAVAGPLEGRRLEPLPSRRGFWFSIAGAIPGIELHLP